jgi:hypothetical protein
MKRLFLIVFAICASKASSYTVDGHHYITDGTQSDVRAACAAAPDDGTTTVTIPDGTYTWGKTLTIKKAIHLRGQNKGKVVIKDRNATGDMIFVNGSANANTTIRNLIFVDERVNSNYLFMLDINRQSNSNYTVCGHDCDFYQNKIYAYSARCIANGIIWWNDTFVGSNGTNGLGGISFVCSQYGYGSWNTPDTMGMNDTSGLNNSYVENCTFYDAPTACCDFDDNSRVVFRYNTVINAALGSHGQETGIYGTRHWEVYDNTFIYSTRGKGPSGNKYPLAMNDWFFVRGGTGVVTQNSMDDLPGKTGVLLNVFSITRGMNDGAGGEFCPVNYPAPRQTGWGWSASSSAYWGAGYDTTPSLLVGGNPGYFAPDGTGATLDPLYVWNNTGGETSDPGYVGTQTYYPDNCGNGQTIGTYLQEGRDYYVNQASPTWAPYTYPHPLHSLMGH